MPTMRMSITTYRVRWVNGRVAGRDSENNVHKRVVRVGEVDFGILLRDLAGLEEQGSVVIGELFPRIAWSYTR